MFGWIRDSYLDLTRLALKTAVPGVVMVAITPLSYGYRSLVCLHASHVLKIRAQIRDSLGER